MYFNKVSYWGAEGVVRGEGGIWHINQKKETEPERNWTLLSRRGQENLILLMLNQEQLTSPAVCQEKKKLKKNK